MRDLSYGGVSRLLAEGAVKGGIIAKAEAERYGSGTLSAVDQLLCQRHSLGIVVGKQRCARLLVEDAAKMVFADKEISRDVIQ